jgi:hypothetical protein
MKRILHYLCVMHDFGLLLHHSSSSNLVVYTDPDWAGCPNNVVSWSAKRQTVISCSSTEAEYHAIANGVAEATWLRQLLHELQAPPSRFTLIYCDNISAVYVFTNPIQHQRQCMKHVVIDLHFIWEKVVISQVRALHVLTTSQFTDILMKGLPSSVFNEFLYSLNICRGWVVTVGGGG